jgi:hypothetical protein
MGTAKTLATNLRESTRIKKEDRGCIQRPSVGEMMTVYRYLKSEMAAILQASRAISIFDGARAFRGIYFAAGLRAGRRVWFLSRSPKQPC